MDDVREAIRRLYTSRGNVLEAAIADGLVRRGVDEQEAQAAARTCASRIIRNGLLTGAATTVIVGAVATPAAGVLAGGSAAAVAGLHTFLQSDACQDARRLSDMDIQTAVDRVLKGL